jgi:hypothetical protein
MVHQQDIRFTNIDELYHDMDINYGLTPVSEIFNPSLEPKEQIEIEISNDNNITEKEELHCVEIFNHIKNCPVCSKLYKLNTEKESYKHQDHHHNNEESNNVNNNYRNIIILLCGLSVILLLLWIRCMLKNR